MSEWIAIEGMQIVGTKGEEYPLAYKNIPNDEGEIVREYAVKFKGKWHMITQQEFFQSRLDRPLNDKGRRMYEVRDVLRTASATPIPKSAQVGVVVPDVVLQAQTAVVRPATLHSATFSNAQPTKQRMVKQKSTPWDPTVEVSVSGQMVWHKKTKNGRDMYGVQGANGIVRVSRRFIEKGTHPPKKIYKRRPGVNPRAPAQEYLYNTGVTKKAHNIGMQKFKAALTKYGRRKDRKAADQPYNTDGETYDPLTQDMPGVDDQMWNEHSRWRSRGKGLGQGWVKNKVRPGNGARLTAASQARKAARIAAGIPLKTRVAVAPGAGKGAFSAFVKANYAAADAQTPFTYAPEQRPRYIMRRLGEMWREQHAGGGAPLSAGQLAAIVDDERSVLSTKRGRGEESGQGKRARV